MNGQNSKNLLKDIASLLGIASFTALLSLPIAGLLNANLSVLAQSNPETEQLLAQTQSPDAEDGDTPEVDTEDTDTDNQGDAPTPETELDTEDDDDDDDGDAATTDQGVRALW